MDEKPKPHSDDKASVWLTVLCFFVPLATSICVMVVVAVEHKLAAPEIATVTLFLVYPILALTEITWAISVRLNSLSHRKRGAALSLLIGWALILSALSLPWGVIIGPVLAIFYHLLEQLIRSIKFEPRQYSTIN